ncbi:hypothetical protein [Bradyrhizobium sp. Ash2021]|uniref:hypothetical protein n=1 Tax=Bradyrhizobium sp. Ash2021 TaxID=2954771 RepID=UPI002815338D|nr:hypothetical protein [Bradyrhizobium sp. Ash2021]WMT73650.1 hypothetical protein NL528_37890 [Bradyrhizobium sp. Ash2021]
MSIRNMMWTALPNGFTTVGDKLVLSVYLSPRLVTDNGVDGTLQQFFPQLQDWPATIGPLQFKVQVQGGPAFTVTRAATIPLESPLWAALFNKDTYVRSYQFEQRTTQNIRSYPVRKVLAFLKNAYQAVAIQTPDQPPTRGDLNFEDSPRTITDLVTISLVLPELEQRTAAAIEVRLLDGHAIPPAFGTPATDFYQVRTFHQFLSRRNPDGTPAPLQKQTLPKLDFHDVVSRLSQYPELLRRLGLVVDLELPTTVPAAGNIQVIPQLAGPAPMSPWTAYQVDTTRRRFQPAAGTEVADGMLQLGGGNYDAVEVDVDGAAHKMLDFAFNLGRLDHVTRTPGSAKRFGFPSLRSAGFAATRQGRAVQLHDRFGAASAQNGAIVANPQNGPVLAADDLTRGYRIDVWDSLSGKWHSLCRRDGTYDFQNVNLVRHLDPDEGFTALATSQSADGTSPDLYLPESLFRWAGWSLAVPRIGKTVGPSDTAATPENPAQTEFKLVVTFKPVLTPNDNRLPRLRFGASYQFRARAVDLAGNSLPPDASIHASFSIPPQPVPYLRYEPIAAPVVVLRAALSPTTTPGESVDRIVIRSNFNTPAAAPSERHLAPAKVSQETAEVHGMFDTPTGLDKTVYTMLTQKDGDLGVDPAHPDQPVPHPEAQLVLPYLPDPLAAGAAFVNLPGVAAGTVFTVPFTGTWPNERPFRIVLAEGAGAPVLTETAQERFLTVRIAKADEIAVVLSCYPTADALAKLAIWGWILEAGPPNLAVLQQLADNGGHWMLTPPRVLTLVHAVQQPLIEPQFQDLAAARTLGGTKARLTDDIPLSGKSTIRLDINAIWVETIDDGGPGPQPKTPPAQTRAFETPVERNAISQKIDGAHEFHDTKYRSVTYVATATSRFREYFADSLTRPASDFTRDSVPLTLDILNTARPAAPKVLYVLPTFGWSDKTEGTWNVSARGGGGLRVYLDRPWFSSGAGELLGVVLWGCVPPQQGTFTAFTVPDYLSAVVTQWGMDPIWDAPPPPSQAVPLPQHFRNAVDIASGLTLEWPPGFGNIPISVAGHSVGYDVDRQLWYCDIELDSGVAYFPFIRLALARYQPKSLPDAHLSRVVLADYVQLVPDRAASIAFDGFDPTLLQLAVTGVLFANTAQSLLQVTVEAQAKNATGDAAWVPLSTQTLTPIKGPGATTLWTSPIILPAQRGTRAFRLRLEEFEIYQTGTAGQSQQRLVYADVLKL